MGLLAAVLAVERQVPQEAILPLVVALLVVVGQDESFKLIQRALCHSSLVEWGVP